MVLVGRNEICVLFEIVKVVINSLMFEFVEGGFFYNMIFDYFS